MSPRKRISEDPAGRLGRYFARRLASASRAEQSWPRWSRETLDAVRKHDEEDRTDRDGKLLPNLLPPITLPVMQECTYSAKLGISVPPYLKEGTYDADLALHLALFGDIEAALKVADPSDKELVAAIEAAQGRAAIIPSSGRSWWC